MPISRDEIIENLIDLLLNGNDTARIRAAETLMRQPEFQAGESDPSDPFGDLDADDELSKARKHRIEAA